MNNTYLRLLKLKYYEGLWIYIVLSLVILLIIVSIFIDVYDCINIQAVYKDNILIVPVNSDTNSDILNSGNILMINKKKCIYEILEITPLEIVNNINYQNYYLKISNNNFNDNQIVLITFYYNKQKMIQKILNIIF